MADYDIELGVGLESNAKQNLENEVEVIKRQLSKDKNLQITGHLSDNTLKTMQHQLDSISKNLSLKLNQIDFSQLVNGVPKAVGQAAKQAGQQAGQSYQQAFSNAVQKGNFETKFRPKVGNLNSTAKEAEAYFKTISNSVTVTERMGSNKNLTSFIVDLKNAQGEAERLRYALEVIKDDKGNVIDRYFEYKGGSIDNNGIIKYFNTISLKANNLRIQLDKIKNDYSDMGTTKPIKIESHKIELEQQYQKVENAIKSLETADESAFTSMLNNANKEISVLENLVVQYRNAEYAATSLREKDINTLKDVQKYSLDEFKAKISNSDVSTSAMADDLKELDELLNNISDKDSLTKFLNQFDVANAKFKALKEQVKSTSQASEEAFNYTALEKQLKKIEEYKAKIDSLTGVKGKGNELAYYVQLLSEAEKKYNEMYDSAKKDSAFQESEYNERKSRILEETSLLTGLAKARLSDREANNKTQIAIDANTKKNIELSIGSLEATMTRFKNVSATKLFSSQSQEAKDLRSKFAELEAQIADVKSRYADLNGAELDAAKKEVQDLKKQFSTLDKEVDAAGLKAKSLSQLMKEAFVSFSQYYFAGGALVTGLRTISTMTQKVTELNKAFVNLQIATGESDKQIVEMLSTYNKMAKTLGATTTEVADSADQWLRQGYSMEETNSLIEASMVQSKIGQLESAESTQYLTSALKGYKKEVTEAMGVVDAMSAVDLISATSLGGLAEAMAETANSARVAGVEMEKLLGYEAVIGEVTQDSMSSVGQSLKRIFSRLGNVKAGKFISDDGEDLNDVEKVLGKLGIQLRDSQQEFRNFGEVLDEVAENWNNYSSVEQRAITTALAGAQQSEKLLVLFENYGNAIKYTEAAMESSGTAMEKFSAYQDGIEAKTKTLQASIEGLSDTIVDSNMLKGGIDGINLLIVGLDTLIEKLGSIGTLATVGSGIVGAKGYGLINIIDYKPLSIRLYNNAI